jgi:hypothetical protein
MAEAAAIGDQALCEFADMEEDSFTLLGKSAGESSALRIQSRFRGNQARGVYGEQLKERSKSVRALQRAARMWRARRQAAPGNAFSMAVKLVRRRHSALCEIFEEEVKGREGLDEESLRAVLRKVHPQVSGAQVKAIWTCFVEGTDRAAMDMRTFCSISEALSIGTEAAAEFADLSPADFEALASQ